MTGIVASLNNTTAGVVVKVAPSGGLQQSNLPVTLRNTIQSDATRRLDALVDVTADTLATEAGSTLVYDPVTDKYIVKLLDLDGGSF